jgi:hypothetical protein
MKKELYKIYVNWYYSNEMDGLTKKEIKRYLFLHIRQAELHIGCVKLTYKKVFDELIAHVKRNEQSINNIKIQSYAAAKLEWNKYDMIWKTFIYIKW